jgi:TP901 family phage tail tape measure protein
MADLSTVIQLIFSANADEAEQALDSINKDLSKMKDGINGVAAPFASFADTLLKTQLAALAMGAALAGLAANEAQKFSQAFGEINTLLVDMSDSNLAKLRQDILDYAQGSTQGLDQINKAVYDAISAGTAWEKSIEQVSLAEKAAIAGKADLSDANRILLQAVSAYAETGLDAAKASDILFTTVRTGVTTFPELSASIGKVISIAAQGGISFEELNAAIATLTKTQGTAEAITALKGVITGIIAPSAQAKEAAAALGIEFSASNLKAQGFEGIMRQLITATGGNVDQIAALFGNVEGLSGVLGLVTQDGDAFKSNLEAQQKALGATGIAFDKMKGSLDTGADAWKVFLIQFGAPLEEAFYNIKAAVTEITNLMANAAKDGGPLGPIQAMIAGYGKELETVLQAIQKNLPAALENLDFSGFIDSMDGLSEEVKTLFKSFFGDIDLTTVEGLTKGLQFLVDGFESLTIVVTGIVQEFNPFLNGIGRAIERFNELDDASKLEFGQTLGAFKAIVDAGVGVGLALLAIGRAGADMGAVMDIAFGGVRVAVNILQVAFDTAGLAIIRSLETIAYVLFKINEALGFSNDAEVFKGVKVSLNEVGNAIEQNLIRNAGEAKEGLDQMARGAAHFAGEASPMNDRLAETERKLLAVRDGTKSAADGMEDLGKRLPVTEFDGAIGALRRFEDETGKIAIGDKLSQQANLSKQALDELDKKVSNIEWGDGDGLSIEDPLDKNIKVTQVWNEELGKLVTKYDGVGSATVKATGAFKGISDEVKKTTDAQEQFNKVLGGTGNDVSVVTAAFNTYLGALGNGAKLTTDQIIELTQSANDFKVAMEEIASNERIKTIEAKVSLNIAEIEADTKKVEAAFESINVAIESTGEVLSGLYDNFTGASRWDQLKLETWINEENERRDKAMEMQNKLVQAQIDQIQAKTRAMENGDAMITVNGDGLQPHLESFMWEILKAIQVQASADMQEFLLGVST